MVNTGLHQFSLIGEHSMIAGGIRIVQDVPPYILAANDACELMTDLMLLDYEEEDLKMKIFKLLKNVYNLIYSKSINVSQAVKIIEEKYGENIYVQKVLSFLSRSKRGIVGK